MSSHYHSCKPLVERLLDCFPGGTYGLPNLLRMLDVVESEAVPTAAVECRAQPRLFINPVFVEVRASTPEKLFVLVQHELHHVLLGHTRLFPRSNRVDNLVFDAVINALLCRMFPEPEYTSFFTDLYDEQLFPDCLLRPPTGWQPDRPATIPPALQGEGWQNLREIYLALYSPRGVGYLELYDALRQLVTDQMAGCVFLVGDHRNEKDWISSSSGALEKRSPLLFDIVRQIVERWPQPPDPIAGRSLANLLEEEAVQPRRRPSNRVLLQRLLGRVAGFKKHEAWYHANGSSAMSIQTPLPSFDRRSIVLGALGVTPLLHVSELTMPRRRTSGERVHVYLDVSGSIGVLKGALYGAVLDCREFVHPVIHLFSTEVADISLAELRQGICRTTGGTSIECVAEHMSKGRIRRAVLITDGYVGLPKGDHRETLLQATVGVSLTPGCSSRHDLEEVADYWTELSC
jgi:hypothetical protein